MTTPSPMTISYSQLLERVGHYLYGIRTGFSSDQTSDIVDCIRDGLNRVYSIYSWSCFRPVVEIMTVKPYDQGTIEIVNGVVTLTNGIFPAWASEGILKIGSKFHSVATRDSDTQITLNNLSISLNPNSNYIIANPEIPLPLSFDAIAGNSDLTYYHDYTFFNLSVKQRPDVVIRRLEQNDPQFGRPGFYCVRKTQFDPTVGSRRSIAFYPTPDAEYVLRAQMLLRPVMIDAVNQFPIGGEELSQLILEACLAAAEHNFEEREHVHERRFIELLPLTIEKDRENSAPTTLGPDGSLQSHRDGDFWGAFQRVGQVYFNGDML
jgi:hypothetical protein